MILKYLNEQFDIIFDFTNYQIFKYNSEILIDTGNIVGENDFGIEVVWLNSKKIDTLVYNKSSDNYWAFDSINGCHCQEYDIPDFEYLICDKKKFIHWRLPKNCSTTQLNLVILEELNYIPESHDENIWRFAGNYNYQIRRSEIFQPVSYLNNYQNLKEYTKYFIWRDPIDRFISLCNSKFNKKYVNYVNYNNSTISQYIEEMILLSKIVNESTPKYWALQVGEEQILGQWKHLQHLPYNDVNYVVHIKDVDSFMVNVIGIKNLFRKNVSDKYITRNNFTKEQLELLNNIYKNDYKLLDRFRNKIWKKTKLI